MYMYNTICTIFTMLLLVSINNPFNFAFLGISTNKNLSAMNYYAYCMMIGTRGECHSEVPSAIPAIRCRFVCQSRN